MNGDDKPFTSGINTLLESALRPVGKPIGQLFGGVAGGIANVVAPSYADMVRQQFTHAGEEAPRFLGEALAFGQKRFPALRLAGLGDVALRAYSQPGADVGTALGQTAAFAAAPSVGGKVSKMVEPLAERVGGAIVSPGTSYLAKQAVSRAGGLAGAVTPFEAANALEAYRRGETYNPLSVENLVGTAASVLPFEAMGVPSLVQGYRKAVSPLVTQTPITDQSEVWRVHWNAHDEDKQMEFNDKQTAYDFSDQLRKVMRVEPQVEMAGTMPRQWVKHNMAWSPQQLQGGVFGMKASEVLNTLPQQEMPGQQMLGTLKNKVPKSEWEALPGFEELLNSQPKIHPQAVQEWLDRNAPRVEVKKMGQAEISPEKRELNEMTHGWWDNLPTDQMGIAQNWLFHSANEDLDRLSHDEKELRKRGWKDDDFAKIRRYGDLYQRTKSEFSEQTNWQQVSPKPESEMQDYVEGAVVVPLDKSKGLEHTIARERYKAQGLLFPSSHQFPGNTLGWFRGYMETDAQGRKAFHIIEVQSDWAQSRRDFEQRYEVREKNGKWFVWDKNNDALTWEGHAVTEPEARGRAIKSSKAEAEMARQALIEESVRNHPLLPQWERLTLKAAIDHAIRNGADRIAVSDAETAMMTEGHDVRAHVFGEEIPGKLFRTKEEADKWLSTQPDKTLYSGERASNVSERKWGVYKPSYRVDQEPGMRLHYDRIIPQILRELTGERGEKVLFGEHKMAVNSLGDPTTGTPSQFRQNLIFREPTGEPKTSVTAQSYDLSKTKSELSKRGGFPMFGGEKFVKSHVEQMIREGYTPEEVVKAVDNIKMLPALAGETPLQTLARSVGIDSKLWATMPPGEALPKALEFLTSMFHYNYGQPIDRAAYLARQVALPLARFAPFLKQTAFALQSGEDLASKFYGLKEPKSDVFKFLITVHDFPKQKPLESATFQIAASLAHEAAHNAVHEAMNPVGETDPVTRRAVVKALANVEAIHPDERANVMKSMLKLVVPPKRFAEIDKANMETYKTSAQEFLADFAAVIGVGSTKAESVKSLRDAMTFGDRASQEFSKAIYRDLTSIWSGAKDFLTFTGSNRENKVLAGLVNTVYENLTKIMQTSAQAERTLDTFHGFMDRLQSGALDEPPVVSAKQMQAMFRELDKLEDFPSRHVEESSKLTDEALSWIRPPESRLAGERLGFWKDYFKPMAQLVESLRDKVQSAVPVFALGSDYRGMVSEAQQLTWQLWKDDKGKTDWRRLHWLQKDGSPQERSFSKIGLMENVRQDQGYEEPMTRAEKESLYPEYKRMSPEDKDKVDLSTEQSWAMTRLLARRLWDAHRDRIEEQMAKILMSYDKTMYRDKAVTLSKEAVHWVFDTPKDFDQFQDFSSGREKFFASLPIPEKGKQDIQDAISENLEPWKKLGDRLLGKEDPVTGERPGRRYLPEVRVREWHVAWKLRDEDLPHHEAFKTEAQAVKRRGEVQRKEGLEWVKGFNPKDRTDRFRGAVQEQISSAQQDALDALKASVLSRISSEHPEAQAIIKRIDAELQPATAFQNVTVSPYMRDREFIPGREDLNMVEGLVRYVDAASYQMAKRHVIQAGETTLFNPDMRENPNIRNAFEKYLHFVVDAEGKEFTMLKNMVFFNYLGLNPIQILVEPTQQLVTLAPYLVDKGMGIGEAYSALRKANVDLFHAYAGDKNLKDPIENEALKEAVLKRVVDTGLTSDLYGETDLDFAMERSMFTGNDQLKDKLDLVRRPLYQLFTFARHMYGKTTPAHNSRVAFLTAFRYEYARTHDKEAAVRFATQANAATMFIGGKAARPMVLQQFGQMSGVGGLMYTLGSYTLSTMAMMMRLGRKAILRSGLTEQEKTAATKAAGLMFGTQFALGGVLGLPFVAIGMALLEQVFPGLDVRKSVREAFVNLAGDDEDMGHLVADGAMRGVANLSPVDFGSRFQLGNLLGISPYDGFSWSNVAGPSANMLANYVKAIGQVSTGEFGQAARTAAPSSIKNILQLVHDDWTVRDKAGRMISGMTPFEQTMAAVGFKPKKITNYYEEQAIRERTEVNQARKIRDIRTEAAKFLSLGDAESARATILKGTKEAGPYDPIDMAKEASQLAVEMQQPTLRRHGTRALSDREEEISRLYPHSVAISEVGRVMRQAQLMQQMGLQFGKPSLAQLRTASVVDSLMAQNPRLTVEQARSLAEHQVSPGARRRSLISALLQGTQ